MRKKRMQKKVLAFILAALVVFAAFLRWMPGNIWAAPSILGGTVTQKLDARYAQTFKLPNNVKSTLYDQDGGKTVKESTELKNEIMFNPDWKSYYYVVDLTTVEKGFYVVYENIGYIGGKYADLKLTFTNWSLQSSKWKMHNNITGKEKEYNPLVCFRKSNGGVSIMVAGVNFVKTKFDFLEHGSGKAISSMQGGHFTVMDIDDGQAIRFPADSNADTVYYLKSEKFLELVNEDTLCSPDKQYTSNSDKKAWISVLFSGTSVKTEFMPKKQESETHYYTPGSGENILAIPHFAFRAEAIGYFEPQNPEKRISDTQTGYDSAKTAQQATKSKPYEIGGSEGTSAFTYHVAAKLLPNVYEEFVISDAVDQCLDIEEVNIVDMDYGEIVTNRFEISQKNNLVTASAKASALSDSTFCNNKTYVLQLKVKRNTSKAFPVKSGVWNLVPNQGNVRYHISNIKTVEKETDTVWAGFRYEEMDDPHIEKRVGDRGISWESAKTCKEKESAYRIYDYNAFDFLVRADVDAKGNQLEQFCITDTLEECLDIDDVTKVTITDKNNHVVNSRFSIQITEDQSGKKTITAKATKEALQDGKFWKEQSYVMHMTVHKKRTLNSKDAMKEWLDEDGFTFYIPNTATIQIQAVGEAYEKKTETNISYVWDKIRCELKIEKTCIPYDTWEVGSQITYAVKVSQIRQDGYAVNVETWDYDLPQGMELVAESVKVTDSHLSAGSIANVQPEGKNGWKATCPRMQYGESFVVSFRVNADKTVNGKDTINTAYATAENFILGDAKQMVSDQAEAWVNTPELTIEKYVDHYEHQVGDSVSYMVVVNNIKDYTVAKNVVVSDLSLPKGLKLKEGEKGVKVIFSPESAKDTVGWPVADGTQAIRKQEIGNEVEIIPNRTNTWTVKSRYLSSDANMTIVFDCEATEKINGLETVNQASVTADNFQKGKKIWDDAKIYVNTVDLMIDKTASSYEWEIGDTVTYSIRVSSQECAPGTIARNVVIRDIAIPQGLVLEDLSKVAVNGIPAVVESPWAGPSDTPSQLDEEYYGSLQRLENQSSLQSQENGFVVTIPHLPQGQTAEIIFPCKAVAVAEGEDGWEWINRASAYADNQRGKQPVEDDAEIYINTANLLLDKTVINQYYQPEAEDYDNREPYEFRVGEEVYYQLKIQNIQKNSVAKNVVIEDVSLPEGFVLSEENPITVEGFQSVWKHPIAGTQDAANQLDENHYREVELCEFSYNVELREGEDGRKGFAVVMDALPCTTEDALNPEWKEPLVITYCCVAQEQVNGCEIVNQARVDADNAGEKTDTERIWINSPRLQVVKKADRKEYKVGDLITYEAEAQQIQEGCKARNVVFSDMILTEGVKLQKDSIVLLDEAGRVLDRDSYATEIFKDHFLVFTKRNLISGQRLTIEYQAVIVDERLAGKCVENKITVYSDEGLPKEAQNRVEVHGPTLNIEKFSDKKIYQVGETAMYHLVVTQLREDVLARNVSIADCMEEEGVKLLSDSIQCTYNGQDFTPFLKTTEKGFSMETGKDLKDEDKIEIFYEVKFSSPFLNGKQVKNKVSAKADNTLEERQEHTVKVVDGCPVLDIQKTSDRQEYRQGETGHYTIMIKQIEKGTTARNVIIKDSMQQEGAKIITDTIEIKNSVGTILDRPEIDANDFGYTIHTGMDLAYRESFLITYDVLFEEVVHLSEAVNVARASADNAIVQIGTKENIPVVIGDGLEACKLSNPPNGQIISNGTDVVYTIVITNKSEQDKKNIMVKDRIPEKTQLAALTQEDGIHAQNMQLDGNEYAVFFISEIPAGESRNVSFTVNVTDAREDDLLVNVAQVRQTVAHWEDLTQDSWKSERFWNTNEIVHAFDTSWVHAVHKVKILEETPEAEETPKPQETPEPQETPKPQETPEAEETPKPQETPKAEETLKPQETPEVEETPKPQETPKAEETPKVEGTPKPDDLSDTQLIQKPNAAAKPDTQTSDTVQSSQSPIYSYSSGKTVNAGKTGDERSWILAGTAASIALVGMYTGLRLSRRRVRRRRKKR